MERNEYSDQIVTIASTSLALSFGSLNLHVNRLYD